MEASQDHISLLVDNGQLEPLSPLKETEDDLKSSIHIKDEGEVQRLLEDTLLHCEEMSKKLKSLLYAEPKNVVATVIIHPDLVLSLSTLAELLTKFAPQIRHILRLMSTKNSSTTTNNLEIIVSDLSHITEYSELNMKVVNMAFELINKQILREISDLLPKAIEGNSLWHLEQVIITVSKFASIVPVFQYAVTYDKEELWNYSQTQEPWVSLLNSKVVEIRQLGNNPQQVEKKLAAAEKEIAVAFAMKSSSSCFLFSSKQQSSYHTNNNNSNSLCLKREIAEKCNGLYYIFNQDKAFRRAETFFANPDRQTVFKTMNILESGLGKFLLSTTFPSIVHCESIHVPRLALPITMDLIRQEIKQNTINTISPQSQLYSQFSENGRGNKSSHQAELCNIYKSANDRVEIRLLCSEKITKLNPSNAATNTTTSNTAANNNNKPKIFEKIVIQIHGGGFVAMSSNTHQTYTRLWAKELKGVPLFCIDYRLAPEHPYPAALDDCWQAYFWIVNYVTKYMNVEPKKIVVVGDSAGGNLVLALSYWCAKLNFRKPDGLLTIYPSLYMSDLRFTPSLMNSLNDMVLPHTFMKLVADAYVPLKDGADPKRDPLLSPLIASTELFESLPPLRMITGDKDPLHDESLHLLRRMHALKKDIKMIIYKQLGHAFLSTDAGAGIVPGNRTIMASAEYLRELLE